MIKSHQEHIQHSINTNNNRVTMTIQTYSTPSHVTTPPCDRWACMHLRLVWLPAAGSYARARCRQRGHVQRYTAWWRWTWLRDGRRLAAEIEQEEEPQIGRMGRREKERERRRKDEWEEKEKEKEKGEVKEENNNNNKKKKKKGRERRERSKRNN